MHKDNDELEFKAITEGLGFHHNKTQKKIIPSVSKTEVEISDFKSIKQTNSVDSNQANQNPNVPNSLQWENDLKMFYNPSLNKDEVPNQNTGNDDVVQKPSTSFKGVKVFASVLIDLFAVMVMVMLTFTAFAYLSPMNISASANFFLQTDIVLLSIALFIVYFLLYGTLSDANSRRSLGKRLFNLRLKTNDFKFTTPWHTLVRTVLLLINILTLGIFSKWLSPSRLSLTTVVEE